MVCYTQLQPLTQLCTWTRQKPSNIHVFMPVSVMVGKAFCSKESITQATFAVYIDLYCLHVCREIERESEGEGGGERETNSTFSFVIV